MYTCVSVPRYTPPWDWTLRRANHRFLKLSLIGQRYRDSRPPRPSDGLIDDSIYWKLWWVVAPVMVRPWKAGIYPKISNWSVFVLFGWRLVFGIIMKWDGREPHIPPEPCTRTRIFRKISSRRNVFVLALRPKNTVVTLFVHKPVVPVAWLSNATINVILRSILIHCIFNAAVAVLVLQEFESHPSWWDLQVGKNRKKDKLLLRARSVGMHNSTRVDEGRNNNNNSWNLLATKKLGRKRSVEGEEEPATWPRIWVSTARQ